MKHILTFLLTCISISAWTQQEYYDFDSKKYNLDDRAINSPFMDSIGFSSCYHWKYFFNELTPVEKNKYLHLYTMHTLVQVNDVQAVESFNTQYFALNEYQFLEKLNIRVIKDGKVIFNADKTKTTEINNEEGRFMQLAIENVTPGCYIETIVTYTRNVNDVGSFYVQSIDPIRDFKSFYFTPKTIGIKAKLNNLSGECTSELINDRYVHYYITQNIPALQNESYANPKSERSRIDYAYAAVPNGEVTEIKWTDKGNSIFGNFTAGFEEAKASIKKMLKNQGVMSKSSELEKVFALEAYLKQNFELGNDYHHKNFPDDAIKSHTITQFNMNRLYLMSLMVMEIPVEIVLTGDREIVYFEKDFVSEQYIESILFFFPNLNMYTQAVDQSRRIPYISGSLYDQDALHIKMVTMGGVVNPVCVMKHIPINKAEDSKIIEEFEVKFDSGLASTSSHCKRSYSGVADTGYRLYAFFMEESDVKEIYEQILKAGQSNATLSDLAYRNYNIESLEEVQKPFEMEANLTGTDLLEFAGDEVLFHIGMIIGQQTELYNEKTRQHPIDMGFAHRYERRIVVDIPTGYKIGGLEALNKTITCEKDGKIVAQFISSYEEKDGKLLVTIDESYFTIRLPKDIYDSFSKVINAAADFNKVDLVLSKM